jgi:RNA polymerase sigma factor (TIGR02999 family)
VRSSSPEVIKDNSVTQLLQRWQGGERQAADELMPLVYGELRRLARRQIRRERINLSLQATGLVHEAYVRLVDAEVAWQDRVHFFALAARAMRRVLVDRARARHRAKRGGGATMVTLDEQQQHVPGRAFDLLGLDETLKRRETRDRRKCDVIELHFFGGLTYQEIAEALKISEATVHRELRFAKAWLYKELQLRETA